MKKGRCGERQCKEKRHGDKFYPTVLPKANFVESEAAQEEGRQQPLICSSRGECYIFIPFISFLLSRAAGTLRKRKGL